jgi:homoserine O-acetyltransferase
MDGNYVTQPPSLQFATVFFGIATSGGSQALQQAAPTREKADQLLNARLKAASTADANDNLYQWDSSRDFNPSAGLSKIKAHVLVINSVDDERNPPELGLMEPVLKLIPDSQLLLIPASAQTSGHGTTGQAKWWKNELAEFLKRTPSKTYTQ